MFNFIRNLFNYRYQLVTDDQYYKSMKGEPKDSLTQRELQMLQRIVSELLRYENSDSKLMKYAASKSEKGTKQRDHYFKEYRKSKVKMKKLSALQYRLKHKIAAKG